MRKLIPLFTVTLLLLFTGLVKAQEEVTIKQLNHYDSLTEYSQLAVESQEYKGKEVKFTAVITSNPKSSGLATPYDDDNDGIIDGIGRMHVFVTDINAVEEGRDGMSMQLVSSDISFLEDRQVGDVIEVTGELTFFNAVAQFNASDVEHMGSVYDDYQDVASLLEPREVNISELMEKNDDGTFQIRIENYPKYHAEYVIIKDAVVSNVTTDERPNWALNQDGYTTYIYDTSLRVRNDRPDGYLPGWNYRRGEDGDFVPPSAGALVDVSGYMIINNFNNDGHLAADQVGFKINPFEDGVLWTIDPETGDDVRCVAGEPCLGVEEFPWRNDIKVKGIPPILSNIEYPEGTVKTDDEVVVSVNVDIEGDNTLEQVTITYTDPAGDVDLTSVMDNVGGNTYEFTMPEYPEFTPVSFYIEATDNEGLVGRDPLTGDYGYFVADDIVRSIVTIQKTADGKTGYSPLATSGEMEVDITGLIVSDYEDGVIILQEAAEQWSGVFLEITDETKALSRGDEINVTYTEVVEAGVEQDQNKNIGLTQLTKLEFTVNSSGNDIEDVIPTVTIQDIRDVTSQTEAEPYEGMVVKMENLILEKRDRFDEYTLVDADGAYDGKNIMFSPATNSDEVGQLNISKIIHKTLRDDVVIDAYGIIAASFGVPKLLPRNIADFMSESDNLFTPQLDFPLSSPIDGETIKVNEHLTAEWGNSIDLDGDEVTYEFVLYNDDNEVLLGVDANEDGLANNATITYNELDAVLENYGLDYGESAEFKWNIRVSDGLSTHDVHGNYGGYGDDFEPIFRTVTLERATSTSIEAEDGTPKEFSLKQNYPNPFNPTTNISFALPNKSMVTLEIFDMLGRKVATLVDRQMNAGVHNVNFDASQYASGMYVYRIQAGTFTSTRKMMLIK